MTTANKALTIANITIKTDAEGRYCLNDFHKAAGGEQRHQPRYWLANQFTEELLAEISGIPLVSKTGRNGGTFVIRKLVFAYAMWISPKFHLEVIDAYDRLTTDGVAVHKNAAEDLLANPLKYLEALMGQAKALSEENKRLEQENAEKAKEIEHLASLMTSNNFLTGEGLTVSQAHKNRLTAKAKKITQERGFELTLDREYSYYDGQGVQRTYRPYLFREDVLVAAAEELGLM